TEPASQPRAFRRGGALADGSAARDLELRAPASLRPHRAPELTGTRGTVSIETAPSMQEIGREPARAAAPLIRLEGITKLAACLLIALHIHDELSYDRFHANAGRIYRVLREFDVPTLNATIPATPAALAEALDGVPGIEKAVRVRDVTNGVRVRPCIAGSKVSRTASSSTPDRSSLQECSARSRRSSRSARKCCARPRRIPPTRCATNDARPLPRRRRAGRRALASRRHVRRRRRPRRRHERPRRYRFAAVRPGTRERLPARDPALAPMARSRRHGSDVPAAAQRHDGRPCGDALRRDLPRIRTHRSASPAK